MLKSQTIRLLDVVLIGPAMIIAGAEMQPRRPWLALTLGFFGVATIGYNAVNYAQYRRLQ